MQRSVTRAATGLVGAAALAALLGCQKEYTPLGPGTAASITTWVSGVAATGATVTLRTGNVPAGSNGPVVSSEPSTHMVLGGTREVTVNGASAFSRVIVAVNGARDYYEVLFPSPITDAVIAITLTQTAPGTSFDLRYAASEDFGALGGYAVQAVSLIRVGTGDVQVSISWDAPTDVDLHVVDPLGNEVYYGQPQVATMGELDLDSNPACSIDGVNNENITWPSGAAPRGEYIVRVDYWSACSMPRSKYVVTVWVKGQEARTYYGELTGPGDAGAEGSGVEVARFTY
jgi:hypothetical protein